MGMNIDKARSDHSPRGIDGFASRLATELADRRYASIFDCDIATKRLVSGAIDDVAVFDQYVMHPIFPFRPISGPSFLRCASGESTRNIFAEPRRIARRRNPIRHPDDPHCCSSRAYTRVESARETPRDGESPRPIPPRPRRSARLTA